MFSFQLVEQTVRLLRNFDASNGLGQDKPDTQECPNVKQNKTPTIMLNLALYIPSKQDSFIDNNWLFSGSIKSLRIALVPALARL